jgi:Cu-Zn family superoxide dismutase
MRHIRHIALAGVLSAALISAGVACAYGADDDKDASQAASQKKGAKEAVATIEPSKAPGQDNVRGVVHFTQAPKGVKVHADVTGLAPNSQHGFHIHEKADLSAPDLMSAGLHFNPTMHKHGGPEGAERHGGDLGNLEADADGKATYDATIEGLTIDDPKTGVIGHSVIVHEKIDDLKTDPSGNSGARIAGGVIKKGSGSASSSSTKDRGNRQRGQ